MSTSQTPSMRAKKRITITLTDRAPVSIDPTEWSVIAAGDWHDGEVQCQSNEREKMRVRQHADGRAIVYGLTDSNFPTRAERAGGLMFGAPGIPPETHALVAIIRRVGEGLGLRESVIANCIADLPAEEL